MYRSDKHLMKSLINVTKPNTKVYQTPPFERKVNNQKTPLFKII